MLGFVEASGDVLSINKPPPSQKHKIFSQLSALGATDIDGWRGCEHILYCLRTMTRSYINSYSTSSFSLLSWVNFSLNFCPNLRGAFCLCFSTKDGGLRPLCVGQSGADAQLGSPAIVRETWLTHISPPHIQILCNAQVAFRMVPRDARSCSTCSFINTYIKAAFQEMCPTDLL